MGYFNVGEVVVFLQWVTFVFGKSLRFCNGLLLRLGSHCTFATGYFNVGEVIMLLKRVTFSLGKSLCFCNGFLLCLGDHCAFAMAYFCTQDFALQPSFLRQKRQGLEHPRSGPPQERSDEEEGTVVEVRKACFCGTE